MSTTAPTMTTPARTIPAEALVRRPADGRGGADHGWLKTKHSFSFANYYDPKNVHFEALRVINDDYIAGGGGFPMHPHQDFEIFSYVLEGALQHRDSMGNGSIVSAGGIQYMTAGRGVRHSEFNPSDTDTTHILQIWLMPKVRGAEPRYETRDLSEAEKRGQLALFISEDGRDGSIETLAPAEVYAGLFDGDEATSFTLKEGRSGYLHVASGAVSVNGQHLEAGDALEIHAAGELTISDGAHAEVLLFDLAKLN